MNKSKTYPLSAEDYLTIRNKMVEEEWFIPVLAQRRLQSYFILQWDLHYFLKKIQQMDSNAFIDHGQTSYELRTYQCTIQDILNQSDGKVWVSFRKIPEHPKGIALIRPVTGPRISGKIY